MLRRLRAETPAGRSFNHVGLGEQIQDCKRQGHVVGAVGFGAKAQICAVLLPSEPGERPMVLGFVYEPHDRIDPAGLIALLRDSVRACTNIEATTFAPIVSSAA